MVLKQAFVLCLILALTAAEVSAAQAPDELRERLRHRMETLYLPGELVAGDQPLFATEPLRTLYESRGWRPIWFDGDRPAALQAQLIPAIDLAAEHGLDPEHYHRERIRQLLAAASRSGRLDQAARVDLELLASDALLTLGSHLAYGRVDPESIDPDWLIEREPPALYERLVSISQGQELELRPLLEALTPDYPAYRTLVARLALQRQIADNIVNNNGSWDTIPGGALLRPGDRDPRLVEIRQRLQLLGDFDPEAETPADPQLYDPDLQQAVLHFQERHGLGRDGVIGPRTLAALNVTPQQRIEQLRANLERWRWLPQSLGEEYILVNIAGFDMQVVSNGSTVMQQRVMVGRPYRRTPVFTGRMTYLVLNPSWEVPHRLAAQDQLPKIRADRNYLDQMGFTVLRGWGANEVVVDPDTVDWQSLSARNFPFRLRQSPGPNNALGDVKFMFPNRHNVYLHDTPARGLFAQEDRALSSGCIRVEDPDALTRWLLLERARVVSDERLSSIMASGQETTVRLNRPLPVHLLYWTAWVDERDRVQYRQDIYQRDQRLIDALNAEPVFPTT